MKPPLLELLYVALLVVWLAAVSTFGFERLQKQELLVSASGTTINVLDFVHFYEAGQLTRSSETRQHVYDPRVQMEWQQNFLRPLKSEKVFYMQYVPFIFPLMVPLTLFSPEQAYLVWSAASVGACLMALFFLRALTGEDRRVAKLLSFAVAVLASLPGWIVVLEGQVGLFSLFLLSVYFWAFQRRRDLIGGICLALSSIKPHYAIFLAVPALAGRRWKLLLIAAVAEASLLCLAGFTIGWTNVFDYPQILLHAETTMDFAGVHADWEACIRALFSFFMTPKQALSASFVAMLLALAGSYYCWRKALSGSSKLLNWTMAMTVVVSLSFSPHTNLYDWAALSAAAWVTIPTLSILNLIRIPYVPERAWGLLLFVYPVLSWCIFVAVGSYFHDVRFSHLAVNLIHYTLLFCGLATLRKIMTTEPGTADHVLHQSQ